MSSSLDTLFDPVVLGHTVAATFALAGGIAMIAMRKGTRAHRWLGRAWVGAMLATAVSSLFIRGTILPVGRFGAIHLLSLMSLSAVIGGEIAIRRGRVDIHRKAMIRAFTGLAIAGAFTLLPGRTLNLWAHELAARAGDAVTAIASTPRRPAAADRHASADAGRPTGRVDAAAR